MLETSTAPATKLGTTPSKYSQVIEDFIEKYGDDYFLDDVRTAIDDGGKCIEIFVDIEKAAEARTSIHYEFMGFRTIVIGVPIEKEEK